MATRHGWWTLALFVSACAFDWTPSQADDGGASAPCAALADGGLAEGCACTSGDTETCAVSPTGFPVEYPALDESGRPLGACRLGTRTCSPEGSWGDCLGARGPTEESCNHEDDDCNGLPDDVNNPPSFRYDGDGDGHGAQWSTPVPGCFAPAAAPEACSAMQANCPAEGWTVQVLPLDDCDDAAADRYPGAQEACNRRDDNCDKGGAEEPEEDVDGDGFTSVDYASCAGGFPKTDCYDLNADVRPGQTARFDVAYCLQPNAQMWCFTERQCAKTATCTDSIGQEWGPGSVDYDCDGVEEPLVPDPSEVARYDAACAAAEAPACVSPDAPSYAFSGAACGAVSRHMKCTNDSESGRCAYASTFLMTACR